MTEVLLTSVIRLHLIRFQITDIDDNAIRIIKNLSSQDQCTDF